jgi:radical SAM superfamily enzyme YgiQ (UPF0313 family)
MNVLLVRPAPPKYTIGLKDLMICEPLELEYVAAAIKGHHVEIFDMILERDLAGKIRGFTPDIVGTSSYITGVNKVKEICRTAKTIDRRIVTIVGGVHATLVPEDFNDPAIDIIARGEGVRIMTQVVSNVERGFGFTNIPGLAFPDGDRLSFTKGEALSVDVEALPFPRRDLVAKYSSRYYYLFHQPVALMKTIFGCPFRCDFCFCWRLTDGKVYTRSPESIVEEIEQIKERDVYIVDDTFFVNVEHLDRVHELIVRRNVQKDYLTYCHSDFIVRHPRVISDWAEIGLKACIIGLETPFQCELENYNKKVSVECNTEAVHILRKNKIDVYGSFIADPDWSEKEFSALQDYIDKNALFYTIIQPLTPLPATGMYGRYRKNLIIDRSQNELWDMQHTVLATKLPSKEFYSRIRRMYLHTSANPLRARSLQLRTAPPIWTKKYMRLLFGALRVLFSLRKAHLHSQILAHENARTHT